MGSVAPYPHNVMPVTNQQRPFCPANRERDILEENLENFWAQQRHEIENFTGSHARSGLPLARIKRVMKSNPEVKMVSADTPVILAKACEIFIQELILRAWTHTQSCSRQTIRPCDINTAVKNSEIHDFLDDIVSFEPRSVCHQGVVERALHQQVSPPVHANLPYMNAPVDMNQIEQKNLMADSFINTEEFELNPNLK